MSVNSMTNAALVRRTDFPPMNQAPRNMQEIANAASGAATPQTAVTAALAVIVTYIPTEVLTLYVAVLAAIQNPQSTALKSDWVIFGVFCVATPVIVWLIYAAKLKSNNKLLPVAPSEWPLWEMCAATISYLAWAISLPHASYLSYLHLPPTLAAVIVLITAAVLGLLAPIFQQPIQPISEQ